MARDLDAALENLLREIVPIPTERAPLANHAQLTSRVLAEQITLDRDSPALDVSAMDGFAVRLAELLTGELPIGGECLIGEQPAELPAGKALRIFTGCPLPTGADTVIRLERVELTGNRLRLLPDTSISTGADIRRQGENARMGAEVLKPGQPLTPAAIAALATIGPAEISVSRRLRITVITTGNELVRDAGQLPPWKLRDSNGPALQAMLGPAGWIGQVDWRHGRDDLEGLVAELNTGLDQTDAVVFTGGVSKGDYDLVRPAIEQIGGKVIFHRIASRPGQPTLAAIAGGKPVIGLPGNPLAVLCAGRRVLIPALRKLAGFATPDPPAPQIMLTEWKGKTLPITWWRPVHLQSAGQAKLAVLMGSGDVIGPAQTDGFIEAPPSANSVGPYAFYPWAV